MNQNHPPKRILSLTKRRYFLLMKEQGRKFVRPTMVVQMMPREVSSFHAGLEDAARVGFTVTKQQGNAVIRNRIKRRLRAATRALVPLHGKASCDYVVIGRANTARCEFSIILKDLQLALDRLHAGRTIPTPDSPKP